MDIQRERGPLFDAELKRDFRPVEVREANYTYRVVGPDGRVRLHHRRQVKVFFVSKDQNSICQLVARDLGPATQADPWAIACDGEVEWAQVLELADWAHRKHMELEARRAEVAPLRTAAMLAGVQSYYEEAARRATAQSTFGPYQRIQRD